MKGSATATTAASNAWQRRKERQRARELGEVRKREADASLAKVEACLSG